MAGGGAVSVPGTGPPHPCLRLAALAVGHGGQLPGGPGGAAGRKRAMCVARKGGALSEYNGDFFISHDMAAYIAAVAGAALTCMRPWGHSNATHAPEARELQRAEGPGACPTSTRGCPFSKPIRLGGARGPHGPLPGAGGAAPAPPATAGGGAGAAGKPAACGAPAGCCAFLRRSGAVRPGILGSICSACRSCRSTICSMAPQRLRTASVQS